MSSHLILQEVTDWEYPNHTYIVNENKSRVLGYFRLGSTIPEMFKKPMSFDTRGRKFKQIAKI